jgi:hypothetical protein
MELHKGGTYDASNRLTDEEFKLISSINEEYSKLKNAISDLELSKYETLKSIDQLRKDFQVTETSIIHKYGPDTIVNMKTGELTHKPI